MLVFLGMVLLATVGKMETKVIKQRCICIRELLCSMKQGCPPSREYLAEYLIVCQGVQHVEQDGVRTFSGGAALTGVMYWKASVPLRLPVLRGFKSILGFPFRLGCPCWWVSERTFQKGRDLPRFHQRREMLSLKDKRYQIHP